MKTTTNPKGAGPKKKAPTEVLYRRIPETKKDRIAVIVDAAIGSDEILKGLEWVMSQYQAHKSQTPP